MTVSQAAASRDAVSFEPSRRLFQSLYELLAAFTADVPNATERANASVKALEILRLESQFFSAQSFALSEPSVVDWRRRVEIALAATKDNVAAVESRSERSYLRRLVIDATLALNACDATFFTEPFTDALLAEIDDAEERQNALVAYATRLAARIYRFSKRDAALPERAKAFALLDEIEDLRLFERVGADVVAAVLFSATRHNEAPTAAPNDAATLDLTPFGDDVAEVWEQFESPGGFLELCERAPAELLALALKPATQQEIALRQALSDETRRRLETILTSLDSGVDADESPLSEDDRAELQSVVDEAVIASPFALKNGEFFRAFLERSRNLDAFVPIFERLAEAEKALSASSESENAPPSSNPNLCNIGVYQASALNCADEKTRWLESARQVASRSLKFEGDLRVKLNRLTTLAELEFRFGDKTNGKTAVRELLGLLPRLESPFERARVYRRLVAAHLLASYPKAAQKLASLWKTELDAIEPEDLRDSALVDAFELYAQAVNQDATALSAFVEAISSPLGRLDAEARLRLALIFSEEAGSAVLASNETASDAFLNHFNSTVAKIQKLEETAPDEAVFTLVKIATVFARRLTNALNDR